MTFELQGRNSAGIISQFSPASLSSLSQSPSSYTTQQPGSSALISESFEQYQNLSSPASVEISSDAVIKTKGVNYSDNVERVDEVNSSSGLEMSQALRMIEHQLSLNDDCLKEIDPFCSENENSDLENIIHDPSSSASTPGDSSNLILLVMLVFFNTD